MRGEIELVFWLIVVILAVAALRIGPDREPPEDLSGLEARPVAGAATAGPVRGLGGPPGFASRR